MERDANRVPDTTGCRSGCGFYGSPATDGLCSQCYKDGLKRKQATPALSGRGSPSASSSEISSSLNLSASNIAAIASTSTTVPVVNTPEESVTCQTPEAAVVSPVGELVDIHDESGSSKDDSSQKDKKKKNRCQSCNKKVGLTGFECRCGGCFCSVHRYSDKHDCTFNYRELGASEIRKNNPVIVGKKIQKI